MTARTGGGFPTSEDTPADDTGFPPTGPSPLSGPDAYAATVAAATQAVQDAIAVAATQASQVQMWMDDGEPATASPVGGADL